MRKQKRRGLALMLAFVMLVSLVYVPGATFTTFAEDVQQSTVVGEDEQKIPPVLSSPSSEKEDVLTDEEQALKALREQQIASQPQYPAENGIFSVFGVADVQNNALHLSPAGGKFFKGERFDVKAVNHAKWPYYFSSYNWGLTTQGGVWDNRSVYDFNTGDRNYVYNVFKNIAIQTYGDDNVFPYTNNEVDVQVYEFIDPPQIEKLEMQSRTLNEIKVKWAASLDENIDHYNVYVRNSKKAAEVESTDVDALAAEKHKPENWKFLKSVTDSSNTFSGLDRHETVEFAISAVYKGHVDSKELFESDKTAAEYRTADYVVTTKIKPESAGSVSPVIKYCDAKEEIDITASLNEGYQVNSWTIRDVPENPVAKVLGFGDVETVEAEKIAKPAEDENDMPPSKPFHTEIVQGDLEITANAGLKVYTVTVKGDPSAAGEIKAVIKDGTGKILKNPNRYQHGTVLLLSSTATPGYVHDKWFANKKEIKDAASAYEYTITGAASVVGTFDKEPVGVEFIKIKELNAGKAIEFDTDQKGGKDLSAQDGKKKLEETYYNSKKLDQKVRYGTTLGELIYNATVSALPNNQAYIKNGYDSFKGLSDEEVVLKNKADFLVIDTPKELKNNDLDAALVDGHYQVEFRVIHKLDHRFNTESTVLDVHSGEKYTNEVHRYIVNIDLDVLPPALDLAVSEGGKVKVTEGYPSASALDVEAAHGDKPHLINEWVEGETKTPRHFFSAPKRQITLTPVAYNGIEYEFEGWFQNDVKLDCNPNSSLTIAMNKNYNITAKFSKVEYVIEADPTMTQGKIQYKLGKAWTDLPVTLHYNEAVELRAIPDNSIKNVYWLFKDWIFPSSNDRDYGPESLSKPFRDHSEITFKLNEHGLSKFTERTMIVNVEFMSDYGFAEYHVAGIEEGADLLGHKTKSMVDEASVKHKDNLISFEYHVPYGTAFDDAMNNASFDVTYGMMNPSNVVKLYGAPVGEASEASGVHKYTETVSSPHRVEVTESINPFAKSGDKNQFSYRYVVQQEADEQVSDATVTKGPGYQDEFKLTKEYIVVVTVVVDEPLLTVDVPVGGYVNLVVQESPDSVQPASDEVSAPISTPTKLTTKIHKLTLQLGTNVSLTAVADEGYTFSGWTTGDGYPVNSNSFIMNNNYNVKPIFTANPTVRRHRNNNNTTPQQEIAQILDETTPLGILYRQLFVGYPNGDLRMFDTITRGQLSLILQRAQQYDVSNPPTLPVTDTMEEWYRKEALTALGKGYLTLRSGNIFAGNDPVTGSELVDALNKAFGSNLTLEEAYRLANGVSSDQVAKILMTNATDFQLATSGMTPLGVGSFDADKPVPRETVARIIYAVLYPQAPAAPVVPVTSVTPQ